MKWFETASSPEIYGTYQVGQRRFHNKIQALIDATQTGQELSWSYYPEQFGAINWSQNLGVDITELYARRAQQLRDQYSYLVLHYSGGADSDNILQTFLRNNIKLDEIYVRWPVRYTETRWTASNNDSPINFLSEWALTLKPALEKVRAQHPEIKITVNDITKNFESSLTTLNDDMFVQCHGGLYMGVGSFAKMSTAGTLDLEYLRNHKTGNITGADKPSLVSNTKDVYFYVGDLSVGSIRDHSYENVEHFYITPNMLELAREQCHLLLKYFSIRKDLRWLLMPKSGNSVVNRNTYWEIVKSVVYPYWDWSKFQATRRDNLTYNDMDHFLFKEYNGSQYLDHWSGLVDNIKQSIDPKFWIYDSTGRFSHFKPCRTPYYKIGRFDD